MFLFFRNCIRWLCVSLSPSHSRARSHSAQVHMYSELYTHAKANPTTSTQLAMTWVDCAVGADGGGEDLEIVVCSVFGACIQLSCTFVQTHTAVVVTAYYDFGSAHHRRATKARERAKQGSRLLRNLVSDYVSACLFSRSYPN